MGTTKVRVSVIGATGYAGGETLRLLAAHEGVTLGLLVSESSAGKGVESAFPGFSRGDLKFSKFDLSAIVEQSDVVILAQENGFAMLHAEKFLEAGKKVIDLSADFRLRDQILYPEWYKLPHASPALLSSAVYGLPELHRAEIKKAKLLANPGCYPTASILGLAPLLEAKIINPKGIVIDAKSGVSGAGRAKHSLDYHFPEVNESVRAYGVAGTHRHTPEIEQELSAASGTSLVVTFTPHLIPITRGILATCYADPLAPISLEQLHQLFVAHYHSEPFVKVMELGKLPATKGTYATNQCHIGVAIDARSGKIVVVSVIDNLVKGAAGQAVQNLNLMSGLDEVMGLNLPGVWP